MHMPSCLWKVVPKTSDENLARTVNGRPDVNMYLGKYISMLSRFLLATKKHLVDRHHVTSTVKGAG